MIMEIFAGKGVGEFVENELFSANSYVLICSPSISYRLGEKMIQMVKNGIKVKTITSNSGAGETNKVHQLVTNFLNSYDENIKHLEYKIVSTKEIFVHAKIYVKDGKYAVLGSANFTDESFWHNAESIIFTKELHEIKKIEQNFEKLWNSYKSANVNESQNTKLKTVLKKIKNKV